MTIAKSRPASRASRTLSHAVPSKSAAGRQLRLWPRVQLHIGWRDLAAGGLGCLMPGDRNKLEQQVQSYWQDQRSLVSFSVRSGFDLLLQSLDLEPDDEVIYSALNVRGMISIARRAGLVAVPLDLDVASVTPSVETLKKAICGKSKVLVIAHLFGCRLKLDELIEVAHDAGLLVVEDCAQAFSGRDYPGHPKSDVAMFSFGPLKTSTALGGALINVRDSALRAKMRDIQSGYPVQSASKQAKRIVQFAGLKMLTAPLMFGLVQRAFAISGRDYEDVIADRVRNVAVLKKTSNLRFKPSNALLALLCRRLENFDDGQLRARSAKAVQLQELLDQDIVVPGSANAHHDHWVFPLVADHPETFVPALRRVGFDAANLPRSQTVEAPGDRPELAPVVAAEMLSKLVIVPCYAGLPEHQLRRLAQTINQVAAVSGADQSEQPAADALAKPAGRFGNWRRRAAKQFGKRLIRRLAGFMAGQSLVSNAPVLDAGDFAFLKEFGTNWQAVRGELDGILQHRDHVPAFEEVSSDQKRIAKGGQWQTFILYGFGEKLEKNCSHAPITTELLERIPNLQTAWFSILAPGYHIPAHRGITKGILRCHVGLIVPDDAQNCWMRVDQQKCVWQPGEMVLFDDTYIHEVRNDTDQERVVLLIDFERPMRLWGRLVNRALIQMVKLSAYYKEPKRKLRSMEDQFESATRAADKLLEDLQT